MPSFRPNLPASQVFRSLKQALFDLQAAEKNAVIWFAEVAERKLYKELGYSSMIQFATVELEFSQSKTFQFLKLAESMKRLPALKESVARGEVAWTKAREVVKVATPKTERAWIEEARSSSRRELERKVTRVKRAAMAARGPAKGQATILAEEPPVSALEAIPVRLALELTPEGYARWEALLEVLQKNGVRGSREELVLAALELAAQAKSQKSKGSPYQVVVQRCPECERGHVNGPTGPREVSPATLRSVLCDAHIDEAGKPNRAAVPPKLRRQVLNRDRHRCRSTGCGRRQFLEVHHRKLRSRGGPNRIDNLITLCSGCHQTLHAMDPLLHPGNPGTVSCVSNTGTFAT